MKTQKMNLIHFNMTLAVAALVAGILSTGCATTTTSNTARTGTEQLLISAAMDRAISTVQFSDFA